jgi:molecular chaperone DnaJ
MPDLYRILGVSETADADEIRRAYRLLARQHHPDISSDQDGQAFRQIREAYEILSDEARRRDYDAGRDASGMAVHVRVIEDLEQVPVHAVPRTRRRWSAPRPRGEAWLADDIAIDFPSLDSVLDRMRAAFFGHEGRPQPLAAELLLSRAEAARGVDVPMAVPVRRACPSCGGRGEIWMEHCAPCGGSGEAVLRHQVQITVPAGVRDGSRFRFSVTSPYLTPTIVEIHVRIG